MFGIEHDTVLDDLATLVNTTTFLSAPHRAAFDVYVKRREEADNAASTTLYEHPSIQGPYTVEGFKYLADHTNDLITLHGALGGYTSFSKRSLTAARAHAIWGGDRLLRDIGRNTPAMVNTSASRSARSVDECIEAGRAKRRAEAAEQVKQLWTCVARDVLDIARGLPKADSFKGSEGV